MNLLKKNKKFVWNEDKTKLLQNYKIFYVRNLYYNIPISINFSW